MNALEKLHALALKQIGFILSDGSWTSFIPLVIRVEDMTRSEPSRTNVVNTLDGAWLDSFGRGVSTLTISGNTNWATPYILGSLASILPGGIGDALSVRSMTFAAINFNLLRDGYIHRWHKLREQAVAENKDPDEIKLWFFDAGLLFAARVAPMQFTLRRSKSQPLLFSYNMTFSVLEEKDYSDMLGAAGDAIGGALEAVGGVL